MSVKKNIVFTGGGSGGHVTPISSLVEYRETQEDLKSKTGSLFWFGTQGQLEEKACSRLESVKFVSVASGKLRRDLSIKSILQNIGDLFRFFIGLGQAFFLLRKYKIDTVFCKGGYVALPVCLSARILKIPVVLHESDRHVGLVNNIVSKFAVKSFAGFPGAISDAEVIGQLLSLQLLDSSKLDILPGNDVEKKTLLVLCGSQGASAIFDQLLIELDIGGQGVKSLQVVVVLGLLNAGYKNNFKKYSNVVTFDFLSLSELSELYRNADVALTRGSATTLAEMELFGLPKLIVPLPSHDQPLNAEWYRQKYGDLVLDQKEIGDLGYKLQTLLKIEKRGVQDGEIKEKIVTRLARVWEEILG